MKVKVNGQEVEIMKNTKSIEDAIEERTVASFVIIDKQGVEYRKGQNVEIYEGEKLLFSGIMEKPVKSKDSSAAIYYHAVDCIDWHYLADKRIVRGGYVSQAAGYIVRDIISQYLGGEGITEGIIEDGPIVSQAQFNYVPATDALNALAEKAGFWWKIGPDRKLYFVNRSTNAAPFTINQSDCIKGSIKVDVSNQRYRNTQYILGGMDVTDPITETKKGDGEAKSWVVGFPIAQEPIIKVNGVALLPSEVGIRGLETGKKYYWSKGDNTVSQGDAEPKLISTDVLSITYRGQYPIVAIVKSQAGIETYKVFEGATGIVEAVESISQENNAEAAFEIAQQKLDKYGTISRRVKFATIKPGLESGQLLTVNLPDYEVNEEMLIESVEITETDNIVYYSIVAVAGPSMGSWAKLFYAMAQKGQDLVIRENIKENQIIVVLESFSKTWLIGESPNIFKVVKPGAGLKPGFKPMFDVSDRVKYIAWFNGVTELGRKRITKQIGAASDTIQSTTFLGPNDANATITHVGWIGGWQATDEIGTGILLDKQPYSKVKTSLEALQIVKNDIKGW